MKIIHAIHAGCLVAASLLATACTTNFEELNSNPNKMVVGDIQPANVFEPLLYDASKRWQNYTWYWNNELI